MFPETLVEPMIEAGCPKDGVVMDVFSGSGATCAVAKRMGRSYIGFDINGEYTDIANKRVAKEFYQSTCNELTTHGLALNSTSSAVNYSRNKRSRQNHLNYLQPSSKRELWKGNEHGRNQTDSK
jgi:adenine-specific DNA methylase